MATRSLFGDNGFFGNLFDPWRDPLAGISQVKAIAAWLFDSPDFRAAAGGSAITVH